MLAKNTGVSLATANWMYTVRSIAQMLGCLLPDLVFSRVPPLLFLCIALLVNGITLSLIPAFESILVMNIVVAATGFTFGIMEMGIQSLILKSWGDKESRRLVQLFHGCMAVGAFIGPLIVQPFIQVSRDETLPASCSVVNSSTPIEEITKGWKSINHNILNKIC